MLAHTIAAGPSDASVDRLHDSTGKKPTPIRRPLNSLTNSRTKDPAEAAAQKAIAALELRIRTLRNEIDTLSQAARLRNSSRDSELQDLALKWKVAAQNAAEEVFDTVKDRVQTMGGVQAWRESEKRKRDWTHHTGEFVVPTAVEEDDDGDREFVSQGDELPEERIWEQQDAEDDVSILNRVYGFYSGVQD